MIRLASLFGFFIPCVFGLLSKALQNPKISLWGVIKSGKWWWLPYPAIAALCLSDLFIYGAIVSEERFPKPKNGPLNILTLIYVIIYFITSLKAYRSGIRNTGGIQRVELQFCLLGIYVLYLIAVPSAIIVPLLNIDPRFVAVASLGVLLMDGVIAYGIVMKQIMEVGTIIRRGIAYILLAIYLSGVYFLAFTGVHYILDRSPSPIIADHLPHVIATAIILLTTGRIRNQLQWFVNHLFVRLHELDLKDELTKMDAILSSVTTTSDLMSRFETTIKTASGAEQVCFFIFGQKPYPDNAVMNAEGFTACVEILEEIKRPLLLNLMSRRPSKDPRVMTAETAMRKSNCALAVGVYSQDALIGVVCFGGRLSGRVYNQSEQDALQILVNRFAVALQNARLYTEVQNASIYNGCLVESLASGIIAADSHRRITVLNKEARRILGFGDEQEEDVSFAQLPESIRDYFTSALRANESLPEMEQTFTVGKKSADVRLKGAPFQNDDGTLLGAVLVLHDVSPIRELEKHVRHSDRLATAGKLSANMAHEIKNPLVAIKTFTQLLPERQDDKKFLSEFGGTVGREVDRINQIVTDLLKFTKRSNEDKEPVRLHASVHDSISLVEHTFQTKQIEISLQLEAESDTIKGFPQQIQQILLNLLLNAKDAVDKGGHITVRTAVESSVPAGDPLSIVLAIEDDGGGIPDDVKEQIFVPFFTTKSDGTGLGLALTANLIEQHDGRIEITSEEDVGTCVQMTFPLAKNPALHVLAS